jgi:hypothetical protein
LVPEIARNLGGRRGAHEFDQESQEVRLGEYIYRDELFGTQGGQMTKTLVGDFDAPFPEFLKTEIKESA